jgi:8-oxo-dGTP pyrophosphatase MutT (NUDIX family)
MNAAAGLLYVNDDGYPLLVQPSYKKHWDLPGGIVEPGESPKAAALREAKEELGITAHVGRLLVVDYLPPNRRRPEMVAYIFDGCHLDTAAVAVDGVEVVSWAWCDAIDRLERLETAPILTRRIDAAMVALQQRCTIYLENGWQA